MTSNAATAVLRMIQETPLQDDRFPYQLYITASTHLFVSPRSLGVYIRFATQTK